MKIKLWFSIVAAYCLTACSPNFNELLASKPEIIQTQKLYTALVSNDFTVIKDSMRDDAKQVTTDDKLSAIANLVPQEQPKVMNIVGWHYSFKKSFDDNTSEHYSDALVEYGYSDNRWVLVQVVYSGEPENLKTVSFHLQLEGQSVADKYAFGFKGKSFAHYLMFIFAILSVLFSLYMFVKCLRAPKFKRKWLWAIFSLVGFTKLTIDWSSGELFFQLLSIQLFSAGFMSSGGPWYLSWSIPLGAVLTWRRLQNMKKAQITATEAQSDN